MKTKKYWIVALAVACSFVFLSLNVTGISFDEEMQHKIYGVSTLKGLRAIRPVVQIVKNPNTHAGSLNESELQTRVELALRKAGINVVGDKRARADILNTGTFSIMVIINSIEMSQYLEESPALRRYYKEIYIYAVSVIPTLSQRVKLARDPDIKTLGKTWPLVNFPYPAISGEGRLEEGVKEIIDKHVNEFINDYLAANPK